MLNTEALSKLSQEDYVKQTFVEFLRCQKDIIYMIETYFTVVEPTTSKRVPFKLYRHQKRAIKAFITNRYNLTMKSRQMGLTTIAAAYVAAFMCVNTNQQISALATKLKTSKRFLWLVREFLDDARKRTSLNPNASIQEQKSWLVPTYMDNDNGKESFSLKTKCHLAAESNNEDACRGEVLNLLVIDEVATITKMETIWSSAGITLTRSEGSCIGLSCVTKDTFVFTDKGIQQVEDFIPKDIDHNDRRFYAIEPYNVLGKDKKRTSDQFFINGYGPTRKITTPYSQLEASIKHRIWGYDETDDQYKIRRFEDLKVGDWVGTYCNTDCWGNNDDVSDFVLNKKGTKHINFPKLLDQNWCYLFGLFLSEGCASKQDKNTTNYNNILITCGDDITQVFNNLGLKYYTHDKLHYAISSIELCQFFEYIGFDLTKKAHQKEIPKRLMSISKENMIALIQGIMDGDGYATVIKGHYRVGINLSSEILIDQLRIIFLNFGILCSRGERTLEQLNHYKPKNEFKHNVHTLEINGQFATQYKNIIDFRLERKRDRYVALKIDVYSSPIPNGVSVRNKLMEIGKFTYNGLRKHKIYIDSKRESLSYYQVQKLIELIEEKGITSYYIDQLKDQVLIPNLWWSQIKTIEEKQAYTYDFCLPEIEGDVWFDSVTHSGLASYQTPKGSAGWYFEQYINADEKGWNIIDAHWSQHPDFSKGMYVWIKDGKEGEKRLLKTMEQFSITPVSKIKHNNGWLIIFNKTWPVVKNMTVYRKLETYQYICDGRLRSPWYDAESLRLGKEKTKCELDCSFAGSGAEVLDTEVLRALGLLAHKASLVNVVKKGLWKSYKQFKNYNPLHKYLITADVMTGDGQDFSAFTIIDLTTLEVVATFKDQLDPKTFAKILNQIGRSFGTCLLVVEHQIGLTSLLDLKQIFNYPNLYYSTLKKTDPTQKDGKSKKIGFWQSHETKRLGGDKLEEMINSGELIINSVDIVAELNTWVWGRDGVRTHLSGKHDDLIMCLTMACYVICYVDRHEQEKRKQTQNKRQFMRRQTNDIRLFRTNQENDI